MKKIILVMILIFCLNFVPVMAEEYDTYDEEVDVLEPAPTDGYDIHNDVEVKGGGIYYWYEIWGFRLLVAIAIGGAGFAIYKVKNKFFDKGDNSFYEE